MVNNNVGTRHRHRVGYGPVPIQNTETEKVNDIRNITTGGALVPLRPFLFIDKDSPLAC